ncbi:Predicted arabinose efflux permease, MFS family [Cohnella sp. OV330]|uniref:MFS transporter n=1 Tax=Cohnella sp. OV330 TaxID=1855288 RepID=UPI0008E33F99|nr:MFS transporter [Cohnella sp. OV330]SFB56618.1 Predicted arabinose efflux permease, MFS family [Cohnella sp. OV330]
MIKEKIWTRDFVVVCLSSFFMFLTFYILATAFPLYVKDSMHGNQQQMGLAITIYVVGGVLGRPLSGMWADRFGKKRMTVIGLAVFLAACIAYFGANGMALFLAVRLVHGMSYAVASTASSAAATSLIPRSRQGEGVGYFSMFMSIAMAIGPALGLWLWKGKNVDVLLLAVCVIAALSLAFAMGMRAKGAKPELAGPTATVAADAGPKKGRLRWSDVIEPKALPISIVGFVVSFAYSSLSGFFAAFTEEIHQTHVTALFFVVFAVMIVASRPVIGRVFDRYKEHYLYYPGIALFAIGMIVLGQAHSAVAVLLTGAAMGIGYGALLPCFQTLAIKLAPEHRRGSATGTFFLMFDLGYGVGSYFMGMIASVSDYRMMYAGAGSIALLSVLFYVLLHHRRRTALPAPEARAKTA